MDFHCSLSQDYNFILACPAQVHFIAVSNWDMSLHLWLVACSQGTSHCHFAQSPQCFCSVVCSPSLWYLFPCIITLLVDVSPSHSQFPLVLAWNYLTTETKQPEAISSRRVFFFCFVYELQKNETKQKIADGWFQASSTEITQSNFTCVNPWQQQPVEYIFMRQKGYFFMFTSMVDSCWRSLDLLPPVFLSSRTTATTLPVYIPQHGHP